MIETQEITFTSEIKVEVVKTDFDDEWPCFAAWTSTKGADATPERKAGLINRLIADHHGTPFEHMNITFRVTAPIFVWREHHRHRIGFSYSEESGRYKQLEPLFYLPAWDRPLVAAPGSKQMEYQVVSGTDTQLRVVDQSIKEVCTIAYTEYSDMLDMGILKEVARMVLPVNIMSTCVVTCNSRSLMNFLALRTSLSGSKPMYEIETVATQYEACFAVHAPMTHRAFNDNGRVAP